MITMTAVHEIQAAVTFTPQDGQPATGASTVPRHRANPGTNTPRTDPTMNKRDLAMFHQSIHSDEVAYMAGLLSRAAFWERVHDRDAIVRAAAQSERRQLNRLGSECGCGFCRTMPVPGCKCGFCRDE